MLTARVRMRRVTINCVRHLIFTRLTKMTKQVSVLSYSDSEAVYLDAIPS